jgi:phosphate butyryltransferase
MQAQGYRENIEGRYIFQLKGYRMLKNFNQLVKQLRDQEPRTIAVALAEDADVLTALEKARAMGLTRAILTGHEDKIHKLFKELKIKAAPYQLVAAADENEAVQKAIELVRENQAQVVMKGLCSTNSFLKGILDKNAGLRRGGNVISHLALFESPMYHKLFMMSDAAMNIAPDLAAKVAITENAIAAAHRLGYQQPKVAIISAVEKVNAAGIPSSADAAIIAKMGDRDQIKGAIIDGPLAVDNALSAESCTVKGLRSPVGGDADICIVPNIETGNAFYKLLTVLGQAKVAGIIIGAGAPVVLTSRSDSEESKFLSIVTALKIS